MLPLSPRGRDSNAVAFGSMVMDFFEGRAEVDIPAADSAEADGGIIGLFELGPAFRALEGELDFAVGDGGHGNMRGFRQKARGSEAVRLKAFGLLGGGG